RPPARSAREHHLLPGLLPRGPVREPSGRVVGHAGARVQRAPAAVDRAGAGVRDEARQRRDAGAGLELHRDLPRVGRLGRLLRPRAAAEGGSVGVRPARSGDPDQPVGETGHDRSPGSLLRRLPEADRGPVPHRQPSRSEDRRATRLAAERAGERSAARGPDEGVRLQPETAPSPDPETVSFAGSRVAVVGTGSGGHADSERAIRVAHSGWLGGTEVRARRRSTVAATVLVAGLMLAAACTQSGGGGGGSSPKATGTSSSSSPLASSSASPSAEQPDPNATGIDKLDHLIFIVQENRSFDSYFGTFPGADGIPATNGKFTVFVTD